MARALTSGQRLLLRSDHAVNLISTFYLDEGTYRFCDDIVDLTDGTNTWIGANSLVESVEIQSGADLAAEGVSMKIDGQRMADFGVTDPARVLRDILGYLHQQRRVDLALAFRYPANPQIELQIPLYAGKINNVRLVDPAATVEQDTPSFGYLMIQLDSLAGRYQKATYRTRSQEDQHEIDPDDDFYSFVAAAVDNEVTIYWGKAAPYGAGVYGDVARIASFVFGGGSVVNRV